MTFEASTSSGTPRSLGGSTGLAKVDALRHMIWQHNPFVNVECFPQSATRTLDGLSALLRGVDLAVSTIADENVEMVINAATVRVGTTAIFGRSLRGGTAARVFRVRPGTDACKECLALHRSFDVSNGVRSG